MTITKDPNNLPLQTNGASHEVTNKEDKAAEERKLLPLHESVVRCCCSVITAKIVLWSSCRGGG